MGRWGAPAKEFMEVAPAARLSHAGEEDDECFNWLEDVAAGLDDTGASPALCHLWWVPDLISESLSTTSLRLIQTYKHPQCDHTRHRSHLQDLILLPQPN